MVKHEKYRGRFAPSPTGKLHLGSLTAAMASYCDAKNNDGQWLVRIEDIDTPREVEGATNSIIKTLQNYGFQFKLPVLHQNNTSRQNAYHKALDILNLNSVLYACPCSRKQLKDQEIVNHTCRNKELLDIKNHSLKLKVPNLEIEFNDIIQGHYKKNLFDQCGDCVLKRKDGLFAYQLAVVVDDAYQGITHIIRGIDIIDSTPWQIYLNLILNFKQPKYGHIPILVNSQNQKLSKQTYAKEIDKEVPLDILLIAYSFLNQKPFHRKPQTIDEFWSHAILHWNINKITNIQSIKV